MYRPFLPEAIGVRGMPPAVRPGCPGDEGPAIATATVTMVSTVKRHPAARATFPLFANGGDGWIEPTSLVHPFSCRCSSSIHRLKTSIRVFIQFQPLSYFDYKTQRMLELLWIIMVARMLESNTSLLLRLFILLFFIFST